MDADRIAQSSLSKSQRGRASSRFGAQFGDAAILGLALLLAAFALTSPAWTNRGFDWEFELVVECVDPLLVALALIVASPWLARAPKSIALGASGLLIGAIGALLIVSASRIEGLGAAIDDPLAPALDFFPVSRLAISDLVGALAFASIFTLALIRLWRRVDGRRSRVVAASFAIGASWLAAPIAASCWANRVADETAPAILDGSDAEAAIAIARLRPWIGWTTARALVCAPARDESKSESATRDDVIREARRSLAAHRLRESEFDAAAR